MWREVILAKIRLVALKFLATGDSFRSHQFLFKISSHVISLIGPEVGEALKDFVNADHDIYFIKDCSEVILTAP